MQKDDVDTYISTFDHLATAAGWDADASGTIELMPRKMAEWQDAAQEESQRFRMIANALAHTDLGTAMKLVKEHALPEEVSRTQEEPVDSPFVEEGQTDQTVWMDVDDRQTEIAIPMSMDYRRTNGTSPMDVDNVYETPRKPAWLRLRTSEEKSKCQQEGRCFRCMARGHLAYDCRRWILDLPADERQEVISTLLLDGDENYDGHTINAIQIVGNDSPSIPTDVSGTNRGRQTLPEDSRKDWKTCATAGHSSSAAKRPRSRSDFTPDDWRRRNIPRSDAIPTKKHRSVQRQTPHDIQAPRTWGNAGRTRRVQTSTRMEMRTRPKESTDLPVNIKNFPKRSTTRPERAGPLTDLLAMTVRGGPTREGTVVCRPAKTQITPRNVQHQASVLGSSSDSSTIPKSCYMLNASPVESGLGTSIRKEVNDPLVGQKNTQQKDQDCRHGRNVGHYGYGSGDADRGVVQNEDPRLSEETAVYQGPDVSIRFPKSDTIEVMNLTKTNYDDSPSRSGRIESVAGRPG